MNKENPLKYSLQLSTCEAIISYSKKYNVSYRSACKIAYSNLKQHKFKQTSCGFNLKSENQFYSSFRRFKSYKMSGNTNHSIISNNSS